MFTRTKSMGTAKLRVIAYDVKSKRPLVDSGAALARADYKHWNVMGAGPVITGSVPDDLNKATGESESILQTPGEIARRVGAAKR